MNVASLGWRPTETGQHAVSVGFAESELSSGRGGLNAAEPPWV